MSLFISLLISTIVTTTVASDVRSFKKVVNLHTKVKQIANHWGDKKNSAEPLRPQIPNLKSSLGITEQTFLLKNQDLRTEAEEAKTKLGDNKEDVVTLMVNIFLGTQQQQDSAKIGLAEKAIGKFIDDVLLDNLLMKSLIQIGKMYLQFQTLQKKIQSDVSEGSKVVDKWEIANKSPFQLLALSLKEAFLYQGQELAFDSTVEMLQGMICKTAGLLAGPWMQWITKQLCETGFWAAQQVFGGTCWADVQDNLETTYGKGCIERKYEHVYAARDDSSASDRSSSMTSIGYVDSPRDNGAHQLEHVYSGSSYRLPTDRSRRRLKEKKTFSSARILSRN